MDEVVNGKHGGDKKHREKVNILLNGWINWWRRVNESITQEKLK